MIAMIDKVLME